ncbi:MAG: hypothetical protein KatS3mg085_782 [Candidatus Dojkabacteria bacterium]|nr:MAG: hypothetical protein KatS3mg085_782 [Candidatus Dojkabacteria bacterium]
MVEAKTPQSEKKDSEVEQLVESFFEKIPNEKKYIIRKLNIAFNSLFGEKNSNFNTFYDLFEFWKKTFKDTRLNIPFPDSKISINTSVILTNRLRIFLFIFYYLVVRKDCTILESSEFKDELKNLSSLIILYGLNLSLDMYFNEKDGSSINSTILEILNKIFPLDLEA